MINDKGNFEGGFPIGFSMALAHNVSAFKVFLSLSDNEQNEIIKKARETKTLREMHLLVNGLNLYNSKKNNFPF